MREGKKRNRNCVRCVARAGPPAQSGGILRNRTRAGLVPEVDLIAPDKLSFPPPHLSRQSILKRKRPPSFRAFPFCLSSCVCQFYLVPFPCSLRASGQRTRQREIRSSRLGPASESLSHFAYLIYSHIDLLCSRVRKYVISKL